MPVAIENKSCLGISQEVAQINPTSVRRTREVRVRWNEIENKCKMPKRATLKWSLRRFQMAEALMLDMQDRVLKSADSQSPPLTALSQVSKPSTSKIKGIKELFSAKAKY